MAYRPSFSISLVLPLLLSLSLFSSFQSQTALAINPISESDGPLPPNFTPDERQRQNYWKEGGNDVVHEIWSILRDYEPTWKDSVSSSHPTGFLHTTWYYIKVIFRVLFMNTPTRHDEDTDRTPVITGDLAKGVETLETAAAFDDPDAFYLLAEMNFYGNFSIPRNLRKAQQWYQKLADLDGNSTAQHMLGLMYATGVGGVERDQAKSLLYHTFAAEQGDTRAEMTLAFRHHAGIATSKDCNTAVSYYKRVADKAMDYWMAGPPGGAMLPRNAYRWVEIDGGSYGEGASVSSSGQNAPGRDSVTAAHVDYVLDYLDMKERQGDYNAIFTLGTHYYDAPRGYKRNFRKAQRQFMKVARAYWTKDGKVNPKAPKGVERIAGKAAAYIGRMFLRGEGTEQNFEKAQTWLKRGVANGDSFAQYHMGLMYRDGLGVPKDGPHAGSYLKAAAEQSLPLAQSALGVLFLDQGDIDTAGRYFELAASAGIMEAYYYLAELTNQGVGRERNCGLASVYYKVVAERAEILHSSFHEANVAFERGDYERAFIPMLMAAEQGYEKAQANVAYLLDKKTSVLPRLLNLGIPLLSPSRPSTSRSKLLTDAHLALTYFTRSAKQDNVDSLLKMGDYYLSSGTAAAALSSPSPTASNDKSDSESGPALSPNANSNLEKAAQCYTTAAETHHSAQALWNLGWMHENGIGTVTQDYHMAKRYYDLALEMNKEATFPVTLALWKLRARSWWNGVSGGKVNPIREDEDEIGKRPKTWSEWINRFLDAADEMDMREMEAQAREAAEEDELLGFKDPGMPGGDAEYRGQGHRHAAGGGGGANGQGRIEGDVYGADEWDEFDDGLLESLIIIGLAGALAMLVYARQARQREGQNERQGRGQQPQPPQIQHPGGQQDGQNQDAQHEQDRQNNGLFPQPGQPEFNNWVAGGIGH
ncbi:hypothetical protein PV10_01105 [Exophiala mesophila]|uniref:DOD-type homing endonuclease domain-containing protein n=1 Tax=Exophiala mesophila TaxID=212818 RepID=A0A0D2AEJ4_EXOME|nr:uncharacterized protein PV10_01105 [Exophiala mesophila]KIV97343.1 hypothetical protein PV10_01105 [Exophiala mesophila]